MRKLPLATIAFTLIIGTGFSQDLQAAGPAPSLAAREVVEEFWPDGQLRLRKEIRRRADGTPVDDGSFRRWHDNGLPEYEATFSMGLKEGTTFRYHRNGRPAAQQEYLNGKRNGPSLSWSESSVLVKEEHWREGRPHGTWTVWKNGKVDWIQKYDHGKPVTAARPAKPEVAPEETVAGHLEKPHDPWLRTPPQIGPRERTVVRSVDGFLSVQVNTDEFGNNIVGDAANEPSIAVDPTDPTRMAIGWRQFDNIASDFRQAGWGFTADGGNSWTFPGVIEPGIFRSDPVLNSDADGNFFYNSLTADAGPTNFRCHVFKSIDGGASWDGGVYAEGGDKQWQIIDQTAGIGRGNIYVAWNSFFSACSGGFTRSYDGGQSFTSCSTVAGDPQWGTLAVGPDGELYVSGTGMSVAKSTTMQDSGQSAAWDFTQSVDLDGSIQFSTGPNPGGLLGQNWIDVDHSDGPTRGNVYMVASVDRSSNSDPSDVMFSRSTDGGQNWSAPVRVNDDPGTSAWQWFGTMSVAPDGRIDVVWLDTRNDPGGFMSQLYYSFSEDTGVTWSPNVSLTPAFDPHLGWPQQNKMGDYFHMISDEFGANLAYAATFNGEQDVYFARIGAPACPDEGRVILDRPEYACEGTVNATVLDCGLNTDDGLAETVVVSIDSDTESGFETLPLTETHPASGLFRGAMVLSETDAGGVLHVTEGDTVTVTYVDADDGAGGTDVDVIATAPVECSPPIISNVQATGIGPIQATATFDTNEPTRGTVHFGTSCAALTETVAGNGFSASPLIGLGGLTESTTYFYTVEAEDEAGNVSIDDNGGACYSFTTTDVPNFFTERFATGLDLDGLKLTFSPNGSIDFYSACAEPVTALPTDPAGGVPLVLTDDGEAQAVLADGKTVLHYGVAYPSFWITANGYLTFTGGETSYTETYEQHFAVARVAALFDDLNPATGGTISWKQLADRAVATWEGVPEIGGVGANTFQIELFFDGTTTISYLGITSADAIAGLSQGVGLSPVFIPSDLSESGSCGPRPPIAVSTQVNTETGTPASIELPASDDGLPEDPGVLSFTIVALPTGGYLEDPGAGSILDVPYTLVGNGGQVVYVPVPGSLDPHSFQFVVDDGGTPPDGGESNVATVTVTQGGPVVLHGEPLDDDPGWDTTGQWAYGPPTGGGTHSGDPFAGFTGNNVYGYNLGGDYSNSLGLETLTSPEFDLTGATDTRIEFQRWLGVESATYDHATLKISTNGSTWVDVWNHVGEALDESSWSLQSYDVSSVADGESAVSFRWVMGTTDGSVTYPGWNIDDIAILGVVPSAGCSVAPSEPLSLVVRGDKQTLDWASPADLGGTQAPVYDLLRTESADDFSTAAVCLETDDGANSHAVDTDEPAPGVVFHYLVRAGNDCGDGSWGADSDGAERIGVDCGGGD